MVLFTAFPQYTSVRLILTDNCCQERITCYAPSSVLRDNVDLEQIVLTVLEDIFSPLIILQLWLMDACQSVKRGKR